MTTSLCSTTSTASLHGSKQQITQAHRKLDIFTNIFNTSLSQAAVPSHFKTFIIIPVPKKPAPFCFNDYRPVALTPIIMKCFERLVMSHIKSYPLPHPGPLSVCIPGQTFHRGRNLLCSPPSPHPPGKSTVRMLFIDF